MPDENTNESLNQANFCFCDLAPLYVLDQLNPAERQWVEQQILDCPELAVELAQYQAAVTAIPYAVEPLPAIADVQLIKQKLFDRLDLVMPKSTETSTPEPTPEPASSFVPFLAIRSDQVQWQPHRAPRAEVAILYVDPVKRERVGLLRAEPDMVYPPHRHGGDEEIYMLSGDLALEGIVYHAGDYIRSAAGSTHTPAHSVSGCMFFFRSSLDDEY